MSLPDFQYPSLKLSVASTAAKIEGFTATLDGISHDIKSLEKWLQGCQVRIEVEAVYYESALQTDSPDELEFRTVPVTKITRALAWAEMPDAKTWRLQFREYVSRGFMHLEHGQRLDPPELVHSRPLIETPAAVRMQAVDGLGGLLEKIAKVVPGRGAQAMIEGRLRVVTYGSGGGHLAFAPFNSEGGSAPIRKYIDADALGSDLRILGLDSAAAAEVIASLESTGSGTVTVAAPAMALRRLGLVADHPAVRATPRQESAPMRDAEMVAFDMFWPRLKAELTKAAGPRPGVHVLTIRKWSQHSGPMSGEFTVVFRGGDTLECDTASTDEWRQISSAEIKRVYEIWRDYRVGRRGRAFIAHDLGVQNTTWIIPLLRRYEDLMF